MNHTGLLGVLPRLAFFVACAVLLQSAVNGQAAPEPRILSGTVYYAGGNEPAQNVTVELRTTEGSLIAPLTTTSTGWFEFRGLQRGVYEIAINAAGFEHVDFSVDLSLSSSRGNVIYLRSTSSNSTNSPRAASISAHELSMPQKARDLVESGKKKLYADKNVQGGLADFQKALSTAPGYYEANYQIAMAYLLLLLRDEAEKSFRKSIEVSGDTYADADIGLGTSMLDKRDFAGGEKMIRRGIELSPDSWLGYYELGRALLNENRIDDAEKAALQARSFAPDKAIVYRLLSNVHLQEKNYQALLEDLDAYLKLDSDSPAGIRAKQLRLEVQQKIAVDKHNPAVDSRP